MSLLSCVGQDAGPRRHSFASLSQRKPLAANESPSTTSVLPGADSAEAVGVPGANATAASANTAKR
ncbi:hypothetical protein OG225_12200 [Nocardia sp. NBC_01377]|uniref:hypothetical protein n=1 Tax=Nocardia sp. NBC_01377 TaxID=2903595 RepID=UPI0032489E28